ALAVHGERVWAAAADASRGSLGLAAEEPDAMSDAVADSVFGPEDLRRLRPLGGDWLVRAWCAKRAAAAATHAVAGAIGAAAARELRGLAIADLDHAIGALRMNTTGSWPVAIGSGLTIEATTLRRDEMVLALCRIAGAAFT